MSDEEERKASDPTTPAEALRRLAARDQRLAALVAANPNAPLDLLPRLAVLHPARVAGNPALSLYMLDPSALLGNLSLASSSALIECAETPSFLIALIATSRDLSIRTLAARCPRCPPEVLSELCADIEDGVREHVARNPSTPPGAIARFQEAGADRYLHFKGKPRPLPEPELRALAALGPWGEVLAAHNPACPGDLLGALAGAAHAWRAVLTNPSTSLELFNETILRWGVHLNPPHLRDPRIMQSTWLKLAAQHGDAHPFASELLVHASLDHEIARKLAAKHLDHEDIARAAIRGRWATRELLEAVARAHPRLAGNAQAALGRTERRSR